MEDQEKMLNQPEAKLELPAGRKGIPTFVGIAIIVVVAVLLFGGVFAYQYFTKIDNQSQNPIACTEEAKICPDGSAVGRTGPNCEFAQCPPTIGIAKINQKIMIFGVAITPLRVVDDSRCPSGVNCVWAGNINISVKIENDTLSKETILGLNQGYTLGDKEITFTSVLPAARQTSIPQNEYFFNFSVSKANPTYPSITLISPNGGENYKIGDTVDIRWKVSNIGTGYFASAILIDENGDNKYGSISEGKSIGPNEPGIYQWTIKDKIYRTQLVPGRYKLEIMTDGGKYFLAVYDQSDNYFTITK